MVFVSFVSMCHLCHLLHLSLFMSFFVVLLYVLKPDPTKRKEQHIHQRKTQTTHPPHHTNNDINPQRKRKFFRVSLWGVVSLYVSYVTCVVFHCVAVLSFAWMSFVCVDVGVTCLSWVCRSLCYLYVCTPHNFL